MRIRFMAEEDIDEIVKIENQLFSKPWSRQDFLNSMMDKHNIYITAVNEQDKIVGYCGIWGVIDEGQITNVAVIPEKQGQGIGHLMISKILEISKKEGLRDFTLEVRESNIKAIELYERIGFIKEGIRKNYYEKPIENAVIMWLRESAELINS